MGFEVEDGPKQKRSQLGFGITKMITNHSKGDKYDFISNYVCMYAQNSMAIHTILMRYFCLGQISGQTEAIIPDELFEISRTHT